MGEGFARGRLGWVLVVAIALLVAIAGCGSSGNDLARERADEVARATAAYREYLLENASELLGWTNQLRHKIKLGIIGGAQSRYASARVPFGHLDPVVGSFPALDARLDALRGARPAGRAGAFHRIERELWTNEVSQSSIQPATEVLTSTEWLHERVKTLDLSPGETLADARRTLAELSARELQMKEEPYAEIDILDASAGLEGVEAAFKVARPLVTEGDPRLGRQIAANFAEAFRMLERFGTPARKLAQPHASAPGTSFILSYEVTPEELQPLAEAVKRLGHLFSEAQESVSGSWPAGRK